MCSHPTHIDARTVDEKFSWLRTDAVLIYGHTHVGETLGEIESHQHGVALGETSGLLVRRPDSW